MAVIGITGGTGTIGRTLCNYLLDKGHQVIVLCRAAPQKQQKNIQYVLWNPSKRELDATALAKAEYLINLAGAGVADKRWTASRKKEIAESRIGSCETLVRFLQTKPNKVKGVVSMSAIGWYGPDRGNVFTEDDTPYDDFLGNTCKAWEESIAPVSLLGKRLVYLRTGIVLS
ncbi:MAG: NAD-dependent epimerase/dehydratase family protein, partial [Bacteroidota bacterium]